MKTFREFQEAMDLSFIKGAKPRGSVEDQKKARDDLFAKRTADKAAAPKIDQKQLSPSELADKGAEARGYGKGRYMGDSVEIDDVLIENTGTYAHYHGTKSKGYTVRITDSMLPVGGKVIPVDGKSHAKKVAKEHNAQQWNF